MKVHQAAEKKKIHLQLQSCNTHIPCHVFIYWRKAKRKAVISLSCRPEPRHPQVFRCRPSRCYNSRRNHVLFCAFSRGWGGRCPGFGTLLVSKQFQGNLWKVAGQKPNDAPPSTNRFTWRTRSSTTMSCCNMVAWSSLRSTTSSAMADRTATSMPAALDTPLLTPCSRWTSTLRSWRFPDGQTPLLTNPLRTCVNLTPSCFKVWRHPGLYPSEPVFVESPHATEEDDGVVLSVIVTPRKASTTLQNQPQLSNTRYNNNEIQSICNVSHFGSHMQAKSTFLLVLDAKTFTELGRAEVPVDIPCGTHGIFANAL